jgi:hypothetical protein
VTATLPEIVLYGRPGCHLCEDAHAILATLLEDRRTAGLPAPGLVERNIELDDELHRRYAFVIPVVALADRELELATTPAKLRRFLAQALDGAPVHEGAA